MAEITVLPHTSEKAYQIAQTGIYTFVVPIKANKQQIAKAVAEQYGVGVNGVKVLISKGKPVKFSRGKGRYPGTTARHDTKKAYVSLKEGDSIQLFTEDKEEASAAKPTKVKEKK